MTVCPTGAIGANSVNYNELIVKLQEVEGPILGCSTKPNTQAHARVPCLGMISLEMSIFMATSLKKEIQLNLTKCEKCECNAIGHLQKLKSSLPSFLFLNNLVTDSNKLPFKEKSLSRRSFFSSILDKGRETTTQIIASKFQKIEEQSHGKKSLPIRLQMVNESQKIGDDAIKNWIYSNLRYDLSTNDQCDLCGECRAICPTGAIKLQKKENKLLFIKDRCTGCKLCVEFCPLSCLKISNNKGVENQLSIFFKAKLVFCINTLA